MPLFSLSGFSGGFASKLFSSIESFSASGGTELTPGDGFKYHVFLSPGDFVIHSDGGNGQIQYIIVAGGGGGGSAGSLFDGNIQSQACSGAGGAGGVLTGTTSVSGTTTYPITVGTGGGPAPLSSNNNSQPNKSPQALYGNRKGNVGARGPSGGDSSFNSLTAVGGGGGGGYSGDGGSAINMPTPMQDGHDGGPGGSGGGGGGRKIPASPGEAGDPGTGTSGQGYAGGDGTTGAPSSGPYTIGGGGGGGAGGAGEPGGYDNWNDGVPPSGGDPGAGLAVPAFPAPAIESAIPAPVRPSWTPSVGSSGLYGKGGYGVGPIHGVDFTGQGGGGVGPSTNGRRGGAGIVIVKYPV